MITFQRQLSKNFRQLRTFTSSSILSSKNEDEKDQPKESSGERKRKDVTVKLNSLLQSMVQKDNDQPVKEVQVAQAVKHKEKRKTEPPLAQKLAVAAKDVASSLEGDVEKTESELLNILLRRSAPSSQGLDEVLKGIKIKKPVEPDSRAQQVRDTLARGPKPSSEDGSFFSATMREKRKPQKRTNAVHVDILGAQPTSYFVGLQPHPPPCELRTWQSCVERDMRLAVTHPPTNIYEQLIQWTERGVIWKFPVDNEQGLDEEKRVSFEEHIFLEEHLEGWCPDKGPIRHFMELVCIGLSKNHWLTVEEKKEHIFWYRDYFADKKSMIAELGAGIISVEEVAEQKELPSS